MRLLLLALLIVAGPAAAEPGHLATNFAIADGNQLRGRVEARAGPVFGGVRGGTLADSERIGTLAFYVGLRPSLGPAKLHVAITRPLDARPRLDVDFARPLGERAEFTAHFDLDAEAEVARTEAAASLAITRRTRLRASLRGAVDSEDDTLSLRLTATRRIAPGGTIAIGFAEAERAPPRATLNLGLRF
jgi:hypothetical protein